MWECVACAQVMVSSDHIAVLHIIMLAQPNIPVHINRYIFNHIFTWKLLIINQV